MKQNFTALLATVSLLSSFEGTQTVNALQLGTSGLQDITSQPVLNQVSVQLEQTQDDTEEDNTSSSEPQQYTNDEDVDEEADDDLEDADAGEDEDEGEVDGDEEEEEEQEEEVNEDLYLYASEDGGMAQFMIVADQTNVYGWNAATNGEITPIVSGLKKITSVATDMDNNLLFVADYDYDKDFGYVYQYDLLVDLSNENDPQLQVNFTNSQQIYQNGKVKGLSVNNGTILIADTGASALVSIPNIEGEEVILVEDDASVSALSFCTYNDDGTVYWSEDNKGQQNGALLSLDTSDEDASPVVVIDGLDDIEQFVIDDDFYLYLLSESGSTVYGAYLNNPELMTILAEDLDANSLSILGDNLFIGTDQGLITIQDVSDVVTSNIQSNTNIYSVQSSTDETEDEPSSSEETSSSSNNTSNSSSSEQDDSSNNQESSSNSTQLSQIKMSQQLTQQAQNSSSSNNTSSDADSTEDESQDDDVSQEDDEETSDEGEQLSVAGFEAIQIYALTSFTYSMEEENGAYSMAISVFGLLIVSLFTMTN